MTHGRTRRLIAPMMWCGVVLLCVVGILAAMGRFVDATTVSMWRDRDPRLTPRQLHEYDALVAIAGIERNSTRYLQARTDLTDFNRNFVAYPAATLLHVVPAAVFLALAPLQFSSRIRSRYTRLHRFSGRALLLCAIPIGLSALFFGLLMPFGGLTEASAIGLFGGLFLFAAAKAFAAIRRRDVTNHREWMIRMFAIAVGVSTIRFVGIAMAALTKGGVREMFGLSLWIGWILTLVVAELWIRGPRA